MRLQIESSLIQALQYSLLSVLCKTLYLLLTNRLLKTEKMLPERLIHQLIRTKSKQSMTSYPKGCTQESNLRPDVVSSGSKTCCPFLSTGFSYFWYDRNYPEAFSHRIGGNRKRWVTLTLTSVCLFCCFTSQVNS